MSSMTPMGRYDISCINLVFHSNPFRRLYSRYSAIKDLHVCALWWSKAPPPANAANPFMYTIISICPPMFWHILSFQTILFNLKRWREIHHKNLVAIHGFFASPELPHITLASNYSRTTVLEYLQDHPAHNRLACVCICPFYFYQNDGWPLGTVCSDSRRIGLSPPQLHNTWCSQRRKSHNHLTSKIFDLTNFPVKRSR